jgi:exosortase
MMPARENTMPANVTRQHASLEQRHMMLLALLAVSTTLLWGGFRGLLAYSVANESSSHLLLIPLISAVLIYREREAIFRTKQWSIVGGGIALVAGALLYATAGRPAFPGDDNHYLVASAAAMVFMWAGSFLLCYGDQAARAAAFPLLFLLLMIPMPDSALDHVIYLLRQGSTEISYLLFRALGVPVFRSGFLLYLPKVTIEVATECSGIRSSVALLITCLLAAHLFLRTHWKMVLFVLLAFPLAIVKNGIRIVTLALLSIYVDRSFLFGSLHRDGGIAFFLLALAILAPILLFLHGSEDRGAPGVAIQRKTGADFAG